MRRHVSVPQSESRVDPSEIRLADDQIELIFQHTTSILSQQFATSGFTQRMTSQAVSDQILIPHVSTVFQILFAQSVCIEQLEGCILRLMDRVLDL